MTDSPETPTPKRSGMSTATWILLSITLLVSLFIHHSVYRAVLEPGFQTLPQQDAAQDEPPGERSTVAGDTLKAPAPVQDPAALPAEAAGKPLDTSLDSIYEFDEPPLLQDTEAEQQHELQQTLTRKGERRLEVEGKVFMDDLSTLEKPVVEGGKVDVRITTD